MTYTIAIANTQEQYRCAASTTLLAGMEALARKGIPVGCRGGGCGVCKVRIASGTVTSLKMSRRHVSPDDEASGVVLACRTFPCSDLTLHAVETMARCLERHALPSARP
jgi:ferredoxin